MKISEEIIDSFLRGDLSSAEMEAFNTAMSADPKLQQEVSIQQDIVETLKAHRHQQLKNRLNNIDVKPVGLFASSYVKLAASIGLVALLVSTFTFLNLDKEETSALAASENNTLSDTQNIQSPAEAGTITNTKNDIVIDTKAAISDKAIASENNNTEKLSKKSVQKDAKSANVTYADMDTDDMDEQINLHPQTDGVDLSTLNHGSANMMTSQVKVNIVKDKDLAYRFFNNQLYLHGNFSNSTYELYELNNSPSKQLFLYFDGKYYELIQGKTKVTTLTPITDKATLSQLSQLKAH